MRKVGFYAQVREKIMSVWRSPPLFKSLYFIQREMVLFEENVSLKEADNFHLVKIQGGNFVGVKEIFHLKQEEKSAVYIWRIFPLESMGIIFTCLK